MPKKEKASASIVRKELKALCAKWGWSMTEVSKLGRINGKSNKGSNYERELCKRLSLWWTADKRDDIFWRSSGSGARAKVRGRAGRNTQGQHGDMAATDPSGKAFIDAFTVEMKRGYSDSTIQDILDMPEKGGVQMYEDFFAQTIESYEQAGSKSWLLITKRTRRRDLVWMPMTTYIDLRRGGCLLQRPDFFMRIKFIARNKETKSDTIVDTCGMLLDDWLNGAKPETIKKYALGIL